VILRGFGFSRLLNLVKFYCNTMTNKGCTNINIFFFFFSNTFIIEDLLRSQFIRSIVQYVCFRFNLPIEENKNIIIKESKKKKKICNCIRNAQFFFKIIQTIVFIVSFFIFIIIYFIYYNIH
jgi:hypothetical protein